MLPTASAAEGPEAIDPTVDEEPIPQSGIISWLVGISFLGVSIRRLQITDTLVAADVTIALIMVVAVMGARVRGSLATSTLVRSAPWLWLILIGSMLGLWGVGITPWAVESLTSTVMAIGAFFAFWYVIDTRQAERPAIIGTAIGLTINVFHAVLLNDRVRARGLIDSPNYLGHYAAMAGAVLFITAKRPSLKIAAVVLMAVAIYASSSFGAMAMVAVALMVALVRVAARSSAVLAVVLITFTSLVLVFALVSSPISPESDGPETSTLSQERFERSQTSRFKLWGQAWESFTDEPMGLGPNGVKNRSVAINHSGAAEIHSDPFGFLVERGIPGLLGLVGLWGTIWFASRPGGMARILIAMIITAGLFRETIHFRHLWLLLALAFVLDYRQTEEPEEPEEVEEGPPTLVGHVHPGQHHPGRG